MILDEIAKLQANGTPAHYILCGVERFKTLMRESLMDQRSSIPLEPGTVSHLATSYMGVRLVVSDWVSPDFVQVLPSPEVFLRP